MNNTDHIDYDHGITAVDTALGRPLADASHLIVRNGQAAFVDTGAAVSVPRLLAALARAGLEQEQVEYVLVTHVHLDHAGGAGALMQALPRARLVVHPRGARHMIDPGKLMASTKAIYGEARFRELYGELVPVPAQRVLVVEDGQRLRLGDGELELIHTAGHALHHYCIVDHASGAVFSGDTFGISYREFDTARGAFIYPATTPTDFDPEAAHASVDRIMSCSPKAIFLTHYSRVTELERLAADLHAEIDVCAEIARQHRHTEQRKQAIADALRSHLHRRLRAHGCTLADAEIERLLAGDIELNAQGLDVWLTRRQQG